MTTTMRINPTTPASRIAIIILNWNGKKDTLECLASFQKVVYPNYEIVVVDNGSTDDSVDVIKKQYPDINVIQTGSNLGYAGGNNVGIEWAHQYGADFITILNNDTIVDPNFLTAFVKATKDVPNAGVYGAKIYYYDAPDTIWSAGARWRQDTLSFDHVGSGSKDTGDSTEYRKWDLLSGCALFIRADVLSNVGLLDEDFFLTFEETDWCYRARAKGYQCLLVPNAKLWHKVSASFGGEESPLISYFMARNKLLWADKHLDRATRHEIMKRARNQFLKILLPPLVIHDFGTPIQNYYWALETWWKTARRNLSSPTNKATLYGFRDYYLRRFGDCPDAVRGLRKSSTTVAEKTERLE